MRLFKALTSLAKINFKTLYINFKYLPFGQALKLPILISRRCVIQKSNGKLIITGPINSGMIKIGYGDVGIFDKARSRTIFKNEGTIEFAGKANIGHGSKLNVHYGASLKLGNDLTITAETSIICSKSIIIGNNCLLSWDILIMDTDLHKIIDEFGAVINHPKEIVIGDGVWIGCRCLILKGTTIEKGNVIAANSTINGHRQQQNAILGTDKILRENIKWEL